MVSECSPELIPCDCFTLGVLLDSFFSWQAFFFFFFSLWDYMLCEGSNCCRSADHRLVEVCCSH